MSVHELVDLVNEQDDFLGLQPLDQLLDALFRP